MTTTKFNDIEFALSVEIDRDVHDKVMHWIDKSDVEVSGLGKVEYDEETNTIRVVDAILLPQKNGAASTELDGAAIGKAMFKLKDEPGELRWWWHSHVDMPTFWSKTDEEAIKQLGMGGWFVSTVLNKKREMRTCFSQKSPLKLILDNVKTDIVQFYEHPDADAWDAEYDENVTKFEKIWKADAEKKQKEKERERQLDFLNRKKDYDNNEELTDAEVDRYFNRQPDGDWSEHDDETVDVFDVMNGPTQLTRKQIMEMLEEDDKMDMGGRHYRGTDD